VLPRVKQHGKASRAGIRRSKHGAVPTIFIKHLDTTTIGAFWLGTAFDNVTQTGASLNMLTFPGGATLDSNFVCLVRPESMARVATRSLHRCPIHLDTNLVSLALSAISPRSRVPCYGFMSLHNSTGAIRIRGDGCSP